MSSDRSVQRGVPAEGISWRLGEDRPCAPDLPFRLTYVGEGVVSVPGLGNFARGTTASVNAKVAERYRGLPDWAVEPRS